MGAVATKAEYLESGPVARELGVSVETLRYWERTGRIAVPLRTASGRRLFTREQIERIRSERASRDATQAHQLLSGDDPPGNEAA